MPEQTTSHGQTGYFGTTLEEPLGFVIESASISDSKQKAPFVNGKGNTVGVTYYGDEYSGSLSGKMIDSTEAAGKRAAVAAGAVLAMPQLEGGRKMPGLTIADSTKTDWTNTDYASFEVSFTGYPFISVPESEPAA